MTVNEQCIQNVQSSFNFLLKNLWARQESNMSELPQDASNKNSPRASHIIKEEFLQLQIYSRNVNNL